MFVSQLKQTFYMKHILTLTLFLLTASAFSQELHQTVRGTIIDFDTKVPIYGAKVVLLNSSPVKGAIADANGDFKLENVGIGRVQLQITAIGYQDIYLPNILVESGKETVLNLEMTSDLQKVEEVKESIPVVEKEEEKTPKKPIGKIFILC